jgi:hypothetical protein
MLLADRLENRLNDRANAIEVFKRLLTFSIPVDKPNLLLKLG